MEDINIVVAVDTFKKLAEIPRVSSAEITRCSDEEQAYNVDLTLSATSYATMAKTTQRCYLKVNAGKVISTSISPAVDSSADTIKACFSSLPGSRLHWTIILREMTGKAGKMKRFVELWRDERCFKSADVTEHHGAFIKHENYGSFSIHEDTVLYSAEANPPEKEVDITARKDGEWPSDWMYEPDLGEQSGGLMRPTVFLMNFDIDSKEQPRLSKLSVEGQESDSTLLTAILGQAVFSSTGKEILLTAYSKIQDGRRLGLIYCTNKPSAVYMASIEKDSGGRVGDKGAVAENTWKPQRWTRLSVSGVSARSPRAIQGQEKSLWIECEEGGAHRDCDSLASYSDQGVTIEIPIVSVPDDPTGWSGLYSNTQLSKSCLLQRGNIFVTDTILGCTSVLILYRLGSKLTPTILTPLGKDMDLVQTTREKSLIWSYKLLCTDGDSTMLAVRSSIVCSEQVLIGIIEHDGTKVKWTIVRRVGEQWEQDKDYQRLDELQSTIEDIEATKSQTKGDVVMQTIVTRKSASSKAAPCILFPHGGPHGSDLIQWRPGIAALCLAGYTLALPNYHGSLGRGQQFVHSLIGQCSRLDVQDCLASIQQLVKQGIADEHNLFVQGGSHGGFLTTHLIGQYPTLFQKAIVRNPVTAIGQMEATSDIPEWCYSELGFPFNFNNLPFHCPTTNQYEEMQKRSPVHYIDAIQTPLLILLGLKDQRVPPNQSKLLYHHLLAKKKKVKMLAFENDHHALDSVEAELLSWEASLRWISQLRNLS